MLHGGRNSAFCSWVCIATCAFTLSHCAREGFVGNRVRYASGMAFAVVPDTSSVQAGDVTGVTVIALDGAGHPTPDYVGKLEFASSDKAATLPGPVTIERADHGKRRAAEKVSTTVAGVLQVSVHDINDVARVGAGSIHIEPGAVAQLLVTPVSSTVAGAQPEIIVRAVDQYGNSAPNYVGTLHVTLDDAQSTRTQTTIVISPSDQVPHRVTLPVTVGMAGIITVTATDPKSGATGRTTIPVIAGKPKHLGLALDGNVAPFRPTPLRITVLDDYGNQSTDYTGTVRITSSDSMATLPAPFVFLPGNNGLALAGNVTFRNVGTQSLLAADIVDPEIFGSLPNINVEADEAVFRIVLSSNNITAGMAQDVTVTLLDPQGFAVPYSGTLHFSSDDPTATLPSDATIPPGQTSITLINSVIWRHAGTHVLSARDIGRPTMFGASMPVTVSPASTTQLSLAGPTSIIAGQSARVSVTALDTFGNPTPSYQGTLVVQSLDMHAVLPAPVVVGPSDAGQQSFDITLKTQGAQLVLATDNVTVSISGSLSIAVTPAAASHFVVTGHASPSTAGVAHAVTVTALDAAGNVDTNYRGTVHISSNDAQATAVADYTFTAGNAGVSPAQSITLKTATTTGAIFATDVASVGRTGSQTGITITAAAFSNLVVLGYPSPTTTHVPHNVTIRSTDAYGNIVSTYAGTIHISSNDSTAPSVSDYTFSPTDAGVVNVSVTLYDVTNTASITATDIVTASLTCTQDHIAVIPAPASGLLVAGYACPGQVGTAQSIYVVARDPYNNVDTNYSGTITFSSNDPAAILPSNYTFTSANAGVSLARSVTLNTAGTNMEIFATDVAQPSINGVQANITVSSVFTIASGIQRPEIAVEPLVRRERKWGVWLADGTGMLSRGMPCLVPSAESLLHCMHNNERNVLRVPEFETCEGLRARDALNAFAWTCQENEGSVSFVSTNFTRSKGVTDLIDWTTYAWLENHVIVDRNDIPVMTSAATRWFSDELHRLDAAASTNTITEPGVYLATQSLGGEVRIEAPNVVVLTKPSRPGANGVSVGDIIAKDVAFVWLEGNILRGGLSLSDTHVVTLRNVAVISSRRNTAVALIDGSHHRLANVVIASCAGDAFHLATDGLAASGVSIVDSGGAGLVLSGHHNSLEGLDIDASRDCPLVVLPEAHDNMLNHLHSP